MEFVNRTTVLIILFALVAIQGRVPPLERLKQRREDPLSRPTSRSSHSPPSSRSPPSRSPSHTVTENQQDPPENCLTWFDGCNICEVIDGELLACTRRFCILQKSSKCLEYDDQRDPISDVADDCLFICTADYSPVCGSDGVTYSNECSREAVSCLSATEITTECTGECPCPSPQQDLDANCPFVCTANYRPICGSNGVTYANDCNFQAALCRSETEITVSCEGECPCQTDEQDDCLFACTADYSPVCGSDGTTYSNSCNLEAASCQSPLAEISVACEGECPCDTQPSEDCLLVCPFNYDPVCGSNGVTYPNECSFEATICQSESDVTLSCQGECPCNEQTVEEEEEEVSFSSPTSPKSTEEEPPPNCVLWFDGCNTCFIGDDSVAFCTLKYCSDEGTQEPYCIQYEGGESKEEDTPDTVIIPSSCTLWFDGCNTCFVQNGELSGCTRMSCEEERLGEESCLRFDDSVASPDGPVPPAGCTYWFDGCNTCTIEDGQLMSCTLMACEQEETPRCLVYEDEADLVPPEYCIEWFDGCNTCFIDGDMMACTEMYCAESRPAMCLEFDSDPEIPEECISWFDGCNVCLIDGNGEKTVCSTNICVEQKAPKCLQEGVLEVQLNDELEVPEDCEIWFDGCNTCLITEEQTVMLCTEKYCSQESVPVCLVEKPTECGDFDGDCFGCINNECSWQPQAGDKCTENCAIMDISCFTDTEHCVSPYYSDIPYDCISWFDGCNSCIVQEGRILACTEMACATEGEPTCLQTRTLEMTSVSDSDIPLDCVTWFDGCNTCFVDNGSLTSCTKKHCEITLQAECVQYDSVLSDTITDPAVPPATCTVWFDGCNTCEVHEGEFFSCTLMYCQREEEPFCMQYD